MNAEKPGFLKKPVRKRAAGPEKLQGGFPSGQTSPLGRRGLVKLEVFGSQIGLLLTFDGSPFMQWVMDFCRWIVQVVSRPKEHKGFVLLPKRPCGRTHSLLADGVSAIGHKKLGKSRPIFDI